MATLNAEHINPFLMAAKKILQDMCFVENLTMITGSLLSA